MPSFTPSQVDSLHELEARHPFRSLAALPAERWAAGWQPLDLALSLGGTDRLRAALVTDLVTVDRAGWHPRAADLWADQADAMGARTPWWDVARPFWPQFLARHGVTPAVAGRAALSVTVMARALPPMPLLEAPPSQPAWARGGGDVDPAVLSRVRALLAKAESTTFEAEAEALTAKAQELITRHAIDVALVADDVSVPGGRRILLHPPYAKAKFLLLGGIARANTCRAVLHGDRIATVVGHAGDLHLVEMLYTSLLLQGTAAVTAAGRQESSWGSTRSWRHGFWMGFAGRISQRLAQAAAAAQADHQAAGGEDVLPVLASRHAAVEEALTTMFPSLGTIRTSVSNGAGLDAGRRFADRANLGGGDVGGGARRALGR